jgi:hypothetical protein
MLDCFYTTKQVQLTFEHLADWERNKLWSFIELINLKFMLVEPLSSVPENMAPSSVSSNDRCQTGFQDQGISQEDTTDALRSGYMADSESKSQGTGLVIRRHQKYFKPARASRVHPKMKRPFCSHPLSSRQHKSDVLLYNSVDCSWIRRLYHNTPLSKLEVHPATGTAGEECATDAWVTDTNTPFSMPVISKIAVPDDFARMVDSVQQKRVECIRQERMRRGSFCPLVGNMTGTTSESNQKDESAFEYSSDSDQSDVGETTQENEFCDLVDVVSDLLDKSHKIQTRYRSYSYRDVSHCLYIAETGAQAVSSRITARTELAKGLKTG